MTYNQKKAELAEKERQLEQLKEKVAKGQVSGNGAPQMIQDLVTEINALKIELQQFTK